MSSPRDLAPSAHGFIANNHVEGHPSRAADGSPNSLLRFAARYSGFAASCLGLGVVKARDKRYNTTLIAPWMISMYQAIASATMILLATVPPLQAEGQGQGRVDCQQVVDEVLQEFSILVASRQYNAASLAPPANEVLHGSENQCKQLLTATSKETSPS
jgi:hypothetical protein